MELKGTGGQICRVSVCGYNPEKNLFNMPPEESEVAGNLCHKTPIRMEVGEKQTEVRVGQDWPHTPGRWRQRVSGVDWKSDRLCR